MLNVGLSDSFYALFNRSHKAVAYLDLVTTQALQSLEGLPEVKFKAVIESGAVAQSRKGLHSLKGIVQLSINVYGPLPRADQVGKTLSVMSTFLQHPFFLEPSCNDYFNPQLFRVGNEIQNLSHLVGLTEQDLRAKTISEEVEHILESLDDVSCPDDGEFENSLVQPETLRTQLKK